ncbi:hypothetical protein, partial [Pseudomonas viridiflava]|uniref:hypothetical protein n=1 Tax=Pseudomonas viridiflava TaxID=33069 RepID=UPI0019825995
FGAGKVAAAGAGSGIALQVTDLTLQRCERAALIVDLAFKTGNITVAAARLAAVVALEFLDQARLGLDGLFQTLNLCRILFGVVQQRLQITQVDVGAAYGVNRIDRLVMGRGQIVLTGRATRVEFECLRLRKGQTAYQ